MSWLLELLGHVLDDYLTWRLQESEWTLFRLVVVGCVVLAVVVLVYLVAR
jgi:hypothetical protein